MLSSLSELALGGAASARAIARQRMVPQPDPARRCGAAGAREEAEPLTHIAKASVHVRVHVGSEATVQKRYQRVAQERPTRHPLVIAPTVVFVRAVEAAAGEVALDPIKQRLVPYVHAKDYLRGAPRYAKVAFADEDAHQHAGLELVIERRRNVSGGNLFHRMSVPIARAMGLDEEAGSH